MARHSFHSRSFEHKMRCRSSSRTDARVGCRAVELSIRSPIPRHMVRAHRTLSISDSGLRLRVFSKPTTTGWTRPHCACLVVLMKRLGYTNLCARRALGASSPNKWVCRRHPELLGIHQYACAVPADIDKGHSPARNARRSLTRRETRVRAADIRLQQRHRYGYQMGWPADVVRNCDSPSAWPPISWTTMLSYALISRVFPEKLRLTRDDVPTTSRSLVDDTAISGARLYWKATPVFQCQGFPSRLP